MIRTDGTPTVANYRERGENFPRKPVGGHRPPANGYVAPVRFTGYDAYNERTPVVGCCDFDIIVNPSHAVVMGVTTERTCPEHEHVGSRIRLADWRHDHGDMRDEYAVLISMADEEF